MPAVILPRFRKFVLFHFGLQEDLVSPPCKNKTFHLTFEAQPFCLTINKIALAATSRVLETRAVSEVVPAVSATSAMEEPPKGEAMVAATATMPTRVIMEAAGASGAMAITTVMVTKALRKSNGAPRVSDRIPSISMCPIQP
ncbi:unnamed protein product [Callosobruchus maculatus]|uniref:Uncharacterized protein n=1 Tax=Callosobruchus maculatus TaxID=64391 RepID=A0A653DHV9_CALMS|nr:unnamed protein product [Callosobruchus maculatus]